jgi:single-strand DNA-binding protein
MLKTFVIGHLGKDCVVNTVNGRNVINFTVAHTKKWKDAQGNQREDTTWLDCGWWLDKTAIAQYLKKGQQVFVEGEPSARAFTRNNGDLGASLNLRVTSVQLLGGKSNNTSDGSQQANTGFVPQDHIPSASEVTEPIDDLPF